MAFISPADVTAANAKAANAKAALEAAQGDLTPTSAVGSPEVVAFNNAQGQYATAQATADQVSAEYTNQQNTPVNRTLAQDGVGAALDQQLTDQATTPQATTANFSLADYATKQAETIQKMASSSIGVVGDLIDSVSRSLGLKKDPETGNVYVNEADTYTPVTEYTGPQDPTLAYNNLPSDADNDNTWDFKLRLRAEPALTWADDITFDVMPNITESRSASYESFQPIQHPGEILKYKATSARDWSISVKLISRSVDEATANLQKINILRSWVMPFYGQGTASNQATKPYLGAPPPIITMTAYGDQMIGPVKCVLETYSWAWDNDMDYIYAFNDQEEKVPFPVKMELNLKLKESFSPAEYSGFDLMQYKRGNMSASTGAFVATQLQPPPAQAAVAAPKSTAQPVSVTPQKAATTAPPGATKTVHRQRGRGTQVVVEQVPVPPAPTLATSGGRGGGRFVGGGGSFGGGGASGTF